MSETAVPLLPDLLTALEKPQASPRVFSLMGPNGAGKSKLLRRLSEALSTKRHFLLPPERRLGTVNLQPGIRTSGAKSWDEIVGLLTEPKPSALQARALRAQGVTFNNSLAELITAIQGIDSHNFEKWKNDLAAHWDSKTPPPDKPQTLITEIEEQLSTILGYRVAVKQPDPKVAGSSRSLTFTRSDGVSFGSDNLSDGEKQIVLLSIFLAKSSHRSFILLADEPELYLNESRAIEIWERIERSYPNAVFLHATHNIAFATRETVDATFLLRPTGEIEAIDRSKPVPAAVVREMVGARLQVLRSTGPVVFCEDELSKFILEDLFCDQPVQVIPLAGCESVKAAVQGEPGWEQVRSEGAPFCGVIDRDARTNDEVEALEKRNVFCLPVWDAEAALLAPEIGTWMMSRLLRQTISNAEYVDILTACAEDRRDITLFHVGQHLCWREKPELFFDSGGLNPRSNPPAKLVDLFSERVIQLQKAVSDKDALAILKLHLGKMMYKTFARRVKEQYGLVLPADNPIQKYVELRETNGFLDVLRNIEWMAAFKQKVESRLGRAA